MKKLLILISSILLFSCGDSEVKQKEERETQKFIEIDGFKFRVVSGSDGHTYYTYTWSHGRTMEHYIECEKCREKDGK